MISHAANLKDYEKDAGVCLDIPDHLQSDFKALIQYGNEARRHYGPEVKRSVRFFEEECGLILHLGLPSGQWLRVTPSEAREMSKFRRQQAGSTMRKAMTSSMEVDDSLLMEAAAKAFAPVPSVPLTGANAVPVTSTPNRQPRPEAGAVVGDVDESMPPAGDQVF